MADNETQKIVTESKTIQALVEHEAWPILREKLVNRIKDLIDLSNLDLSTTPEKITLDLNARKKAADILFNFLSVDIEAGAQLTTQYDLTLKESSAIIRKE